MNRTILVGLSLIVSLASAARSLAQAPAAPAGIPGMPAAPAAAPAAPSGNVWSMICPTADQKAACKQCFCNSPLGQLLSGAAGPMAAMSGGLMGGPGSCCSQNSLLNDLKKAADDPNGLAARIKSDEEDAKARRAAVRYLGTVDCSYWPEATEVLKSALRKDRNECVRFEAALSLRRGCCCNRETVEALTNCVLGEDKKDPFPAERSERVRAVAAEALMRCPLMEHGLPAPNEKLVKNGKPRVPEEYARKVAEMAASQDVIANARAALVSLHKEGKAPPAESAGAGAAAPTHAPTHVAPHVSPGIAPRNNNTVSGIVTNAFSSHVAVAVADSGPRQPFFSDLTKQLTGKQDPAASSHQRNTTAQPRASAETPRDTRSQIMVAPAALPFDSQRQAPAIPAAVPFDLQRQTPALPAAMPFDTQRQTPALPAAVPFDLRRQTPALPAAMPFDSQRQTPAAPVAFDLRRPTPVAPGDILPDPWRQIPDESRHIPDRGFALLKSEREVVAAAQIGVPLPDPPTTSQPLQASASVPSAHYDFTFLPARPLDVSQAPPESPAGQAVNPAVAGENRQQQP